MKIRLFRKNRTFHKWAGLICGAFILILSVSGFLLMHPEEFGIQDAQISGKYLPSKYFNVQGANHPIQALLIPSSASPTIYVGTKVGVYQSQDSGATWKQTNQGLFDQNIRALAAHPDFPKTIYAGTALGIFKSEVGGENWSEWIDESSGLTDPKVNDLSIDAKDPDIIFAATEGGIFKSEDEGETWDVLYDKTPVLQIEASLINPMIIYAVTPKNIIRSINGGSDWENVWQDEVTDPLSILALNTDPEFLYSGTQKGLLKSFNTGRNWVKDKKFSGSPVTAGYVYANNLSHLLFGSGEKIYRSKDGGDTWIPLSPLVFGPSEATSITHTLTQIGTLGKRTILVGTTSGLFMSNDEGNYWEIINLSGAANQLSPSEMKMDVVKVITEIHNGRFFGSYFILLVDIATIGLILLTFSGVLIAYYQSLAKNKKTLQNAPEDPLQRQETADELVLSCVNS